MSGLDQRTMARREALAGTTAVTESTTPDVVPWPAMSGDVLRTGALDGRHPAVPLFPLELLPQPWRDWTSDAARLAGAPVDYVAQALLASVAAVSSKVVVIPTRGWQEPVRLWLAAVGLSSTGKSSALAMVQRVLWTLEDTPGLSGSVPPRRIVLREGRFERLAGMLSEDRRGRVLWRDDVVACLAPPAGARSVRQLEPYPISIVGTVHPAGMEPALRQDPDSAARFLYAWPQPQAFHALPGLEPSSTTLVEPFARLLRVLDLLELPHGLLLDEPAQRVFEAFRARLHEERREAEGIEAAWLGKGGRAVACLAGVLSVMSWAASDAKEMSHRVDARSMERAVSLWWDYYRPHALALLRQSGASEESHVLRVVRWLRACGRTVISRKDVRRCALREEVDAREADDVIACLVEAGALRPRPRVPTDRAGRPALRWDVNPLLLKQTEESSLGARHSSGAIIARCDKDARLESRAPGDDGDPRRPNRPNRPNPQTH